MSDVTTVNVLDPRLEPPPEPVYPIMQGPLQKQEYKLPASGLSDSMLTFNNMTIPMDGRIFLDTFEIEYVLEVKMAMTGDGKGKFPVPADGLWTFESFPLAKVTDQCRININGVACISRPAYTIPFLERYWDQEKLLRCYADHCPCLKPNSYNDMCSPYSLYSRGRLLDTAPNCVSGTQTDLTGARTIISPYFGRQATNPRNYATNFTPAVNNGTAATLTFLIREPIFCSPFSSRLDKNYGSPLYNISSIDFTFTLNDLRNMFSISKALPLSVFSVTIKSAQLCYDVLTVPNGSTLPDTIYRPFIQRTQYITDATWQTPAAGTLATTPQTITSGVYTLGTVPTAIWLAVAPTQSTYQTYRSNSTDGTFTQYRNKVFGNITHVNISLGNTTQILNTASIWDLYRTCKANGLQDDWFGFANTTTGKRFPDYYYKTSTDVVSGWLEIFNGDRVGSVLRLIPGVDILIPDNMLVPSSNAKQMNFQAEIQFVMDTDLNAGVTPDFKLSLWVIFEYSGVLSLSPGHGNLDMMPVTDLSSAIESAAALPTITPSEVIGEELPSGEAGTISGTGWWDNFKRGFRSFWEKLKRSKLLSTAVGAATDYLPAQAKVLKGPLVKLTEQIEGSGYMDDDGDDRVAYGSGAMGMGAMGAGARGLGVHGGAIASLNDFI